MCSTCDDRIHETQAAGLSAQREQEIRRNNRLVHSHDVNDLLAEILRLRALLGRNALRSIL